MNRPQLLSIFTALAILSLTVWVGAQSSSTGQSNADEKQLKKQLEGCPKEIVQLANDIRGKTPDQTLVYFQEKLGHEDGNMGSGLSIPFWNRYSGKIVFHPFGPSYVNSKAVRFWLVVTHNPVEKTILSKYEMYAPYSSSNSFWIGNLDLNTDNQYVYTPADKNGERLFNGKRNFFQEHPAGTFKITYRKGVKKDQMLESLADQTILCDIAFSSSDGKATITYPLASSSQSRQLSFRNCQKQFEMLLGWPNGWK